MASFIPDSDENKPTDHARGPAPAHGLAIKQWTREILRLDADAVVTVMELSCSDPGCPLVETVIAVFDANGSRKWKLHQAQVAVTQLDVQFALAGTARPPRDLTVPTRPDQRTAP